MDASTSTESSNIKIPETIVTNKGLQDERKKTNKRPNSPISAEESPRKKQKIKKSRKKKKIIRRNKVCSADERKYLRPDRPDVPSPHVCDVDLFLNSICPTL
ncbi:unnamed protein product [Rhizophagus irregularis]|nr:unnamed protein product [Rhizophagus irregularis]